MSNAQQRKDRERNIRWLRVQEGMQPTALQTDLLI